jgi:HEAT repeat protein
MSPVRRAAKHIASDAAVATPSVGDSAIGSEPRRVITAAPTSQTSPRTSEPTAASVVPSPKPTVVVAGTVLTTTDSVLRALTLRSSSEPEQDKGQAQVDTALLGKVLRTDKDARVRKAAAWVLQGHRAGVPLLAERLRVDESDEVREMSAWALAGMRVAEVAPALTVALRGDKSDEVRATAAWGLGQLRSPESAPTLLAALDDVSPDVRLRAIWALGQQELSAAPARVLVLLGDEKSDVRQVAAWLLSEILDKSSIPAIRAAFLKERDAEVLQAEFRALLFMGDRSQGVIDRAMNHEDPEIRARAVRMIAGQGPGSWPWPWPRPDTRPEP